MNEQEFNDFIEQCINKANIKQNNAIDKYKLESYKNYFFDQITGKLQFKNKEDKIELELDVSIIGTFAPQQESWMWGWANESFVKPLRDESAKIKELVEITGEEIFNEPTLKADEEIVNELISMAIEVLDSQFFYQIPGEQNHLFLSIK